MEKHISTFSGGMNKDVHPSAIKPSEYLDATNAVMSNINTNAGNFGNTGDLFSLSNETGFDIVGNTFPANNIVLGMCPLNGAVIIFSLSVDPTDLSIITGCEIGILEKQAENSTIYTYSVIYTDTTNDFNFNLQYPIRSQARVNYDNRRIVYFTDNFNPPRWFDLDRDYTSTPFVSLETESSLFDSFKTPIIDYAGQVVGGSIRPGVYQFAVRYLNQTLDPQAFSVLTQPIPVVNEDRTVGRNSYDGAPYNAAVINKKIKLTISNLEQAYRFIEVAVIYYSGPASEPRVNIFTRLNVGDQDLELDFTGQLGSEDVAVEELTAPPISYSTAKFLTQKDGRLFLSNLSNTDTVDIQTIASKITVDYEVEEILLATGKASTELVGTPVSDSWYSYTSFSGLTYFYNIPSTYFNDYKDEDLTFRLKGWRRDEVYSLGIVGIYKDGSYSFVGHIPGPVDNGGNAEPPTVDTLGPIGPSGLYTTGKLGGWLSGVDYAADSGILDQNDNALESTPIRHHRMPSLFQQPHFTYNSANDTTYIRVLGLKLKNIQDALDADPVSRDRLQGLILVYQPRDTVQNKGVLAQGFLNPMMLSLAAEETYGNNSSWFNMLTPNPTTGWNYFAYNGSPDTDRGFPFGKFDAPFGNSLANPTDRYSVAPSLTQQEALKTAQFICPELLFTDFELTGNKIKIVSEVKAVEGNLSVIPPVQGIFNNRRSWGVSSSTFFDNTELLDDTAVARRQLLTYYGGDHATEYLTDYNVVNQTAILSANSQAPYGTNGIFPEIVIGGNSRYRLYNFQTQSYICLVSDLNIAFANYLRLRGLSLSTFDGTSSYHLNHSGLNRNNFLFNYINENANQYSTIEGATFISSTVLTNGKTIDFNLDNESNVIFNGDTFICLWGYKNDLDLPAAYPTSPGVRIHLQESVFQGVAPVEWQVFGADPILSVNDVSLTSQGAHRNRGIIALFVESDHNINYRHAIGEELGPAPASRPYWPKGDANGVAQWFPFFGDSKGYNIQYSFNNNLNIFTTAPFGFEEIDDFPTRTIYSEQILEGEFSDRMRIFLANSYQDLPKNKGEITGQFIHKNTLFLHTERSLFQTFVNQTQYTQTNESNVVIGSGQIFALPPQEVYPLKGGYAGCLHDMSGVNTPFGYFFVDFLQKKAFLFGEGLQEISSVGMSKWFFDNCKIPYNINFQDENEAGYNPNFINNINNPEATGILSWYDPIHKRVLMTIRRDRDLIQELEEEDVFVPTTDFHTLSLSLLTNKWISFHSYSPSTVVTVDDNVISTKNNYLANKLYRHNSVSSNFQMYDETFNFDVTLGVNPAPLVSKVFDNFLVYSDSFNASKDPLLYNFFDELSVSNEYQNSFNVPLLVRDNKAIVVDEFAFNVNRVTDHFRLKIPHSLTLTENLDPYDPLTNQDVLQQDSGRMRNRYLRAKFSYDNSKGFYFVVHSVLTIFRQSFR